MHADLKNSTLKVFNLGGHNFMDASADEFNEWILKYIVDPTAHAERISSKDALA
jgi:hypothetical protein